ncbi:MAG: hypothetical protein U0835_19320 [Isosphaeraceae bacterium]
MLRNSGVTDQNVNAVLADYQRYKHAIASINPVLQAQIAATKADLIQKLGRVRFGKLVGTNF